MAWLRNVIEYDSDQVVNKSFFCPLSSHAFTRTITQKTGLYSVTHIHTQTYPMETQTYILSPTILLRVMFLLPVTRTLPINNVQIPLRVCVWVWVSVCFLRK